jgi:tRNA(adenine34) deaminase
LESDESFMRLALVEAETAFAQGEVPVGAVLVYQGEVIARAHNRVESWCDATAHAEMLCLRIGAEVLKNWRLIGATLYCTLEPCAMCAGAMINSRLDRLIWGAPDIRCGAHGSWVNLMDAGHPIHRPLVISGVLSEACAALMKDFFKQRRMGKSDGEIVRRTCGRTAQETFEFCPKDNPPCDS